MIIKVFFQSKKVTELIAVFYNKDVYFNSLPFLNYLAKKNNVVLIDIIN